MSPSVSTARSASGPGPSIICMIEAQSLGCDQVRTSVCDRLRGIPGLMVVEVDLFTESCHDDRFFRCSLRVRDRDGRDVKASFAAGRPRVALEGALLRLRHNLIALRPSGGDEGRHPDPTAFPSSMGA